jgi:hypothetical protein
MSIPDALTAFAEPSTTTVTILEIKTGAILDSDVWGLRHPSGLSIHPSRNELWTILTDILVSKRFNGFFSQRCNPHKSSAKRPNAYP